MFVSGAAKPLLERRYLCRPRQQGRIFPPLSVEDPVAAEAAARSCRCGHPQTRSRCSDNCDLLRSQRSAAEKPFAAASPCRTQAPLVTTVDSAHRVCAGAAPPVFLPTDRFGDPGEIEWKRSLRSASLPRARTSSWTSAGEPRWWRSVRPKSAPVARSRIVLEARTSGRGSAGTWAFSARKQPAPSGARAPSPERRSRRRADSSSESLRRRKLVGDELLRALRSRVSSSQLPPPCAKSVLTYVGAGRARRGPSNLFASAHRRSGTLLERRGSGQAAQGALKPSGTPHALRASPTPHAGGPRRPTRGSSLRSRISRARYRASRSSAGGRGRTTRRSK